MKKMKKILATSLVVLAMVVACWASTKFNNVLIQNSSIVSSTGTFNSVGLTTFTGNKCVYTNGSGQFVEGAAGITCAGGGTWDYATAAGCTTPENDVCTSDLTFAGGGFSDASYIPVCSGGDATNGHIIINSITRLSATQVRVYSVNYSTDVGLNFGHIYCMAYHP